MSAALASDVEVLRSQIASELPEIEVTLRLPREIAKKVLALLDAEQSVGAVVIPARQELTTTEAARILGISRPTLMKLIYAGRISFRKVGRHHRIPASAIPAMREFLDEDHMAVAAEISSKYGHLD